jgi:hypothetical protein
MIIRNDSHTDPYDTVYGIASKFELTKQQQCTLFIFIIPSHFSRCIVSAHSGSATVYPSQMVEGRNLLEKEKSLTHPYLEVAQLGAEIDSPAIP